MRKSFLIVLLIIAVGTLLLVVPTTKVSAAHPRGRDSCSNSSAVGSYGYSCTGVAPNAFAAGFPVEPFAGYGVVTSDGRGQWHGSGKVSFNGKIVKWTHDTRSAFPSNVNHDCTGDVTYAVTITDGAATFPVNDAHFDFVIVNDGKEVKGFPVDPGYAVSCQLILIDNGDIDR